MTLNYTILSIIHFNICKISIRIILLGFVLQIITVQSTIAGNTDLPLWEIGIGAAPIAMPSYRGSRNRELNVIPIPYVDYRGDFLRIDREGIRGVFYDSDRLRIEFSGDGAIPSSPDKKGPRRGMPDLDPILEIGPSVNYIFHESPNTRLRLRFPVRIAMAIDFSSIYHAGWKMHPNISLDIKNFAYGWNAGVSFGPIFADRDYHAFYYDVEERYATLSRAPYKSSGGYSGTSLMLTSSRRFKNIWAGVFFRYDCIAGAVFTDSPVVETRHSFMAGLGISWIFYRSAERVPPTHDDYFDH